MTDTTDIAAALEAEERGRRRREEEARHTADAARAEWEASNRDVVAAARLMRVSPKEISSVSRSPLGTAIVTADGVEYVVIPSESPDAEGKVGLMLRHRPPSPSSFPVYASPTAGVTEPAPRRTPGRPFSSPEEAFAALGVVVPPPAPAEIDDLRRPGDIEQHLRTLAAEREEVVRQRSAATTVADARRLERRLETIDFETDVLERRLPGAHAEQSRAGGDRADARRRSEELAQARAIVAVAPVFAEILTCSERLAPARTAPSEALGPLRAMVLFARLEAYLAGAWTTEVLPAAQALVDAHPEPGADPKPSGRSRWRRPPARA